jgi:hypothetical protein
LRFRCASSPSLSAAPIIIRGQVDSHVFRGQCPARLARRTSSCLPALASSSAPGAGSRRWPLRRTAKQAPGIAGGCRCGGGAPVAVPH